MNIKLIQKKVDQMYWDYDRLSRSGQDTLDEIATLVGLEDKLDDAEVEKMTMFLNAKVEGSA
jgi:hypothetical protein|tara:strand:- start:328 stop:513 length:186 start_codon:yes stop_codon:yes gene_type:complete